MNNGRALQGHRRIIVSIGKNPVANRPPPGGWDVACICGWSGGNWPISTPALKAYRRHIDHQIDFCLIRCKRCGHRKSRSEMRHDYRHVCKGCFSELGNEWQRKNPRRAKRHKQNHSFLKRYGITIAEAEELLINQNGQCAICHKEINFANLYGAHIDHNHATEKIRGVLCMRCNMGLGCFDDDIERLCMARNYLNGGITSTV